MYVDRNSRLLLVVAGVLVAVFFFAWGYVFYPQYDDPCSGKVKEWTLLPSSTPERLQYQQGDVTLIVEICERKER